MLKPTESRVKILLADDSVTMHRAVALALKKLPWQLTTCDNGQDALRLALEMRPDVVLADLDMPGLTGAELCHAIREKPQLALTKLILLCGSFDQVDESRLESIPADGRLWKPFESHVLTALIDALLKTAAAREGADPTGGKPGQELRSGDSPTAPGTAILSGSEKTMPPRSADDVVRDMTAETFSAEPRGSSDATIPPLPVGKASTIKERLLPVADVSPETAVENLWSPDLELEENVSTQEISLHEPQATIETPSDETATSPNLQEFSVYRDSPIPTFEPSDSPTGTVELESTVPPVPTTPSSDFAASWEREAGAQAVKAAASAARAAQGLDEQAVRKLVREEIETALKHWFKTELEKALTHVITEIDQS